MKSYLTMRLFLLLLPFLFSALPGLAQIGAMAKKGTTRAVIIGISNYEDEHIPDLHFAHRDAEAMAEFLASAAGGETSPENIKLLLNEKATRGEIATAFYWLVGESKAGDRAIIYFSGHGDMENRILMDQGYLLAYDARASNYMGSGTYAVEMLQKVVKALSQNVEVIMITDACRSGKLAGSETGGVAATTQGLAQQFANEIKILSCEPNQASLESEQWGGGRGIFSYFLIDGLKGMADRNEDLKVNLGEIYQFLDAELSRIGQNPMKTGLSSAELFRVNEDTLLALLDRRQLQRENMAFATPRATLPTGRDTVVHPLYQQFQQAMAAGHLLHPEEGSAYALFQQMQGEEALQPVLNALRLNLAVALQDGAQRAVNAYLEASPEEMARRWQYSQSYRHYPEYLEKAAGLIGPGNILYADLKVRQAYFEGLALRLQGETMAAGRDSILRLAIEKQELALSQDSLAAHVYNELGLICLRLKEYQPALGYFGQARDLSPTWVIPAANISTVLLEMGRNDEAASMAEQALQLREDYAPPRCNLGLLAYRRRDYRAAIEFAEASIAYDSAFANAYKLLGRAWEALDSLDRARDAYLRALQLDPGALTNFYLGFLSEKTRDYTAAEAYYKAAIGYYPDYPDAHYNLGWLYLDALQNYPEAEKYYRRYTQLKPRDTEGMVLVACTLSMQGKPEPALQWLEQALEAGFNGFDDLRSTPFLSGLQADPRFVELLGRYGN